MLQSLQLPFAMLPLLYLSSKPKLMGRFADAPAKARAVYALAAGVLLINVVLVVQFVFAFGSPAAYAAAALFGLGYFFCVALTVPDFDFFKKVQTCLEPFRTAPNKGWSALRAQKRRAGPTISRIDPTFRCTVASPLVDDELTVSYN